MRVLSNAFLSQAEIVQPDRWDHGPLELVFLPEEGAGPHFGHLEASYAISQWNQNAAAGFVRAGDAMEILKTRLPALETRTNPNLIMVPQRADGLSELDVMLASLLPDEDLAKCGIPRLRASMGLLLVGHRDTPKDFAPKARQAFCELIWRRLSPQGRLNIHSFSSNSSLRLLSGDPTFWMHRIFRLCLAWREEWFEEVDESREPTWKPLDALRATLMDSLPPEDRDKFSIRRPLKGGELWDVEDAVDRERVIEAAISGDGVLDSLDPILEVLKTHRCHEDFAPRHSWIKEDFERSFYSKRAKLKVDLVETLDNSPVWASAENEGYEQALFRDVFSLLDIRERRLVIALRSGKSASQIASEKGLAGHASISRKIQAIKHKVRRLLH